MHCDVLAGRQGRYKVVKELNRLFDGERYTSVRDRKRQVVKSVRFGDCTLIFQPNLSSLFRFQQRHYNVETVSTPTGNLFFEPVATPRASGYCESAYPRTRNPEKIGFHGCFSIISRGSLIDVLAAFSQDADSMMPIEYGSDTPDFQRALLAGASDDFRSAVESRLNASSFTRFSAPGECRNLSLGVCIQSWRRENPLVRGCRSRFGRLASPGQTTEKRSSVLQERPTSKFQFGGDYAAASGSRMQTSGTLRYFSA
jgi:hypothetical protein